jgi:SSS family solute:Na+ symporter
MTMRTTMQMWLRAFALAVLLLPAWGHAQSLATLQTAALPPLPDNRAAARVLAVDGRLVAADAAGAFLLSEDRRAWRPLSWRPDGEIVAFAAREKLAVALVSAGAPAQALRCPGMAGMRCGGASGPQGALRAVRLKLAGEQLTQQPLPALPAALHAARLAIMGDKIYVAGLDEAGTGRFFELATAPSIGAWSALPAWPGAVTTAPAQAGDKPGVDRSPVVPTRPGNAGATGPEAATPQTGTAGVAAPHDTTAGMAAAGGDASADAAALAAGPVTLSAQNSGVYLTLRGAPGQGDRMLRWKEKEGWTERMRAPGALLPDAVHATGQAHLLYLAAAKNGNGPARLLSYQTITGSWAELGAVGQVASPVVTGWGNGLLWSAAGAQGPVLTFTELTAGKKLLRTLDYIIIVAYLAGMLGIGYYCYIREKRNSTADFFVGGRSIPFWAAGISLYAANTSSISYIAIPAKAFETNWQYMTNNLIAAVALGFVATMIVPLLRRLDLMSVFHYLEIRFHPMIRTLSSLICIVVQIGSRMSVILLLPSLAIATITGIPVTWSIMIMGGFTIVYTAMGGMKAVVWTDFVQLFVKMGGALFAIGFIIYKLDGGVGEFFQTAMAENKMRTFDFSFDLTKPTVWGFVFLVIFDVVLTFPKDQVLMQRVLSTDSGRNAMKSTITFALISIPGGIIFYTIGTALFTFYKSHPERMNPLLNIDATFPLFIAAELPVGVTGLIIAGILAAAMATLSGIMNSVATLASVDFYEKLVKNPTPRKSVIFAESATVATGLIGIAAALWLSKYNSHSLFDVSIELAGLLGGGFAGAYTLGMFTRRANWQGVAIGIAGAVTLTTFAWTRNLVHPYFYLPISIMLCIGIGYVASYLFPAPSQSLKGLTIYTDK